MNSEKRNKILGTVKKLIVHRVSAESIGSREEAIAFGAKIAELMREYRIEAHEVEPSVIDAMDFSDYGMVLVTDFLAPRGAVPWQAAMFNVIARSQMCEVVIASNGGACVGFYVAGATVDRAVTCGLGYALARSADYLSRLAFEQALYDDPAVYMGHVDETSYRLSFSIGFTQALEKRLKEEETAQADSQALVVIAKALTRTSKYLASRGVGEPENGGEASAVFEVHHNGAAQAGYREGMRANLKTNAVGGGAVRERAKIGGVA